MLFRPHRAAALRAIVAMLFVAFFTTLVGYLIGPLFDQVLTPMGVTDQLPGQIQTLANPGIRQTAVIRWLDAAFLSLLTALGVTGKSRMVVLPVCIFVTFALKNVFAYMAEFRFNAVGLAFVTDLRQKLYERLLLQSEAFHARNPSGDLVARTTGDVDRIQSLFGTDLGDLVQSVATLLGLLVIVVSRSPELTGAAALIAPAILVPVVVIAKRLRSIAKQGRERMGDLTGVLSETIRGRRVVQAYGAEAYEAGRFREVNERTFRLMRKGVRVMALSSPLVETASILAFLLLLGYAGSRIAARAMTLGTFVSFGVSLYMMYQPFKRVTRTNLALQQALASARRLFEVLDHPVDIVDAPGARPLPGLSREIRFENVSFAYPNGATSGGGAPPPAPPGARGDASSVGAPVLQDLTLAVPRGSMTALVGPSGAGKTTLVNLVPRFMDPTAGRVTIDGTDVREVTLASLRGAIGLVTQEVILFDDTVSRNVSYGRDDVPEERIWAALRAANAESFVRALPEGLATRVGEGGSRLSGGQRQRLAIARAILKDPPILILDEATSALDAESERAVQEALDRLMSGRTVLVIAHRLSTVRRADQIVVLESGRLVEQGTHGSLLGSAGLYRRLHDLATFEGERA